MSAISLKWDITGKCNLKCKHCLAGDRFRASPTRRELTNAQRLSIVDEIPESAVRHMNILGGEPTLLGEGFLSVISHCAEKGIKTTFNTNGLTLKQPFIKRVIQAGAAGVIVSIDFSVALDSPCVPVTRTL